MSTETSSKSITKIALVTGASRGLGRNTALSLARKGVDLIMTYHSNRAEADSAVAAIEALGRKGVALQLDSSNVSTFDAFVSNVAAALRVDPAEWQREMPTTHEHFDTFGSHLPAALAEELAALEERLG